MTKRRSKGQIDHTLFLIHILLLQWYEMMRQFLYTGRKGERKREKREREERERERERERRKRRQRERQKEIPRVIPLSNSLRCKDMWTAQQALLEPELGEDL